MSVNETAHQVMLSDGFEMPVLAWGEHNTQATPVVCLHSLFFTGDMFRETARAIAVKRACFAPTYRGHASLPSAGKPLFVDQLARDILEWMSRSGLAKVHLVGSSMGAYVAMEMMRDDADKIASVVLSCCTCQEETNPEKFDALAAFIATGPNDTTANVIAQVMFGADTLTAPSPLEIQWIEKFAETPAAMANAIRMMFEHPAYSSVLEAYTGPVLLLAGAQDRAKSTNDMNQIARHVPHARTHVFDTSGHTPAVEVPERFAHQVNRFISIAELANDPSPSGSSQSNAQGHNHVA